ncbi:hypothetical protein GCM10022252_08260 [Streptosporangium oxazolinicum]|uniref:Uncharacterized protein n=1 Tax=Streptosporangium oxazolinicum TaxID=909287 RepID=A0ABP8ADZ4_9ACTN
MWEALGRIWTIPRLGPSYFLYGLRTYRVPSAWGKGHEFYEDPQTEHVLLRFWPIRDVFDPVLHARPERTTAVPRPSAYVSATDWPALRRQPDLPEPDTADDPDSEDGEAALRRTRARIARQLNPDTAPTFTILRRHAEDPRSPLRANTGATCRARLWRSVRKNELGVDRRIESEDGSRDEVLVSAIVTVLDEDGELLTVRDATETEAARLLAVERVWPAAPSIAVELASLRKQRRPRPQKIKFRASPDQTCTSLPGEITGFYSVRPDELGQGRLHSRLEPPPDEVRALKSSQNLSHSLTGICGVPQVVPFSPSGGHLQGEITAPPVQGDVVALAFEGDRLIVGQVKAGGPRYRDACRVCWINP